MKIMMILSALAFGSVSYAAQINCNGTVFGYNLNVHSSTTKGVAAGDIVVTISSGNKIVKTSVLKVTSSDIVVGQHMNVTGNGPDGSGQLHSTFNASTSTYDGTMDAMTAMGDLSVDLSCSLKGSLLEDGLSFN